MVQVDVFWSYGIGAGFAYAAQEQLKQTPPTRENGGFMENRYFTRTLLYLATLFGPSGLYLVWQFTSWETMHALDKGMPGWLVTAFGITNVTQGLLGFWVTYRLIMAGRSYLAFLQPLVGYFCMFFVLVHGWDGRGYQRFFSESPEQLATWTPATIGTWLTSPVALTLAAMGVVLIPVMVGWMVSWMRAGQRMVPRSEQRVRMSGAQLAALMLFLIFGIVLGSAIVASVLIHQLGWLGGLAAFALVGGAGIYGRRGLLGRLWEKLDPHGGSAASGSAGVREHAAQAA